MGRPSRCCGQVDCAPCNCYSCGSDNMDWTLLICNSNAALDDEFQINLNGYSLGKIYELDTHSIQTSNCKGQFFTTDPRMVDHIIDKANEMLDPDGLLTDSQVNPYLKFYDPPEAAQRWLDNRKGIWHWCGILTCCIVNTTVVKKVPKAAFDYCLGGTTNSLRCNVLEMKNIKDNNNNNYGQIQLWRRNGKQICNEAQAYYAGRSGEDIGIPLQQLCCKDLSSSIYDEEEDDDTGGVADPSGKCKEAHCYTIDKPPERVCRGTLKQCWQPLQDNIIDLIKRFSTGRVGGALGLTFNIGYVSPAKQKRLSDMRQRMVGMEWDGFIATAAGSEIYGGGFDIPLMQFNCDSYTNSICRVYREEAELFFDDILQQEWEQKVAKVKASTWDNIELMYGEHGYTTYIKTGSAKRSVEVANSAGSQVFVDNHSSGMHDILRNNRNYGSFLKYFCYSCSGKRPITYDGSSYMKAQHANANFIPVVRDNTPELEGSYQWDGTYSINKNFFSDHDYCFPISQLSDSDQLFFGRGSLANHGNIQQLPWFYPISRGLGDTVRQKNNTVQADYPYLGLSTQGQVTAGEANYEAYKAAGGKLLGNIVGGYGGTAIVPPKVIGPWTRPTQYLCDEHGCDCTLSGLTHEREWRESFPLPPAPVGKQPDDFIAAYEHGKEQETSILPMKKSARTYYNMQFIYDTISLTTCDINPIRGMKNLGPQPPPPPPFVNQFGKVFDYGRTTAPGMSRPAAIIHALVSWVDPTTVNWEIGDLAHTWGGRTKVTFWYGVPSGTKFNCNEFTLYLWDCTVYLGAHFFWAGFGINVPQTDCCTPSDPLPLPAWADKRQRDARDKEIALKELMLAKAPPSITFKRTTLHAP